MKITAVRLQKLTGTMAYTGEFWEERLVRPVDLYPEHRDEAADRLLRVSDGRYRIEAIFLWIDTDEGVSGLAGPITTQQAFVIEQQSAPLLRGADPLATERIWDRLYRSAVHGRKGIEMMALSAIDCALWDLKGRWAGVPVYRLLGGPTRDHLPAYASALGYSVAPEQARERAGGLVAQGYAATKWFFRHGPASGRAGMDQNVDLVRTVRSAVGDEVDLMLDCWMSWDVPYAAAMAPRLAPFHPRWIEEPVLPDRIESCAVVRRLMGTHGIPVATGEHEYTRWGHKALLEAGAADVLQPDLYWCGGISEALKICALASTYDVQVIPHGHSVPATAQLLLSQPASLCPWVEYLIKWNEIHQFFFQEPLQPMNGMIHVPNRPGMGMELDETKIETERALSWV
ncbi:MAG: mandelate racemase/muconate lactonizing protein [Dehalococcoidia bacterium]|nr:mandelate racemase/muconate lactonizing protein [Dehalococcoidia bacterium]